MFVKRNHSRQGGKVYASVLLVQGERVRAPRKAGRPRKGEESKTVVRHRVLANISKLPAPLVALVEKYCRAERAGQSVDDMVAGGEPVIGPVYGQLAGLLMLARECGVERALGASRAGRLALFLVLARVAPRGSRLSAVRWAETQVELFDEQLTEVHDGEGRRLVLRRNPAMQKRVRDRRADPLRRVRQKVEARNEEVARSRRADPEVSLRQARKWLRTYHLHGFVQAHLDERTVLLIVEAQAQSERERLDGCDVVVTDLPAACADMQTVWDRYGGLQQVERDFRTIKTTRLELRPLYLRKANRTRAHALVTMLALKLARALQRRVAPLGLTCQDALDRLAGVRLVTVADPGLGLWRLPTRWNEPERSVLAVLPPLPAPLLSPGTSSARGG